MTNCRGVTPFWAACYFGHLKVARWLAEDVGISDDVTRSPINSQFKGATPLYTATRMRRNNVVSWLTPFLLRRVLIAYWSVGRIRFRSGLPALGHALEAAVWRSLPRQAMANVLLWLASPR